MATSTVPRVPPSAFLRMLEMRLLAAVRLAASGQRQEFHQRAEARGEVQRRHRVGGAHRVEHLGGDIGDAGGARGIDEICAQALDDVFPQFGGRGRVRHRLQRDRTCYQRLQVEIQFLLHQMRSAPMAARRRPKGSLVPVGFWPMAKMPASVSSLSASATAIPAPVVGNSPPRSTRQVVLVDGRGHVGGLAVGRWRSSGP
jgi:hypothetical protein